MEAITTVSWSCVPQVAEVSVFFFFRSRKLTWKRFRGRERAKGRKQKWLPKTQKKTHKRQHPDADRNLYCILHTIYGKSRSNNLLIGDAFLLLFVWFRYVDDTIVVMQNRSQGEQFVSKPQSVLTIQLNPTYKLIKTHIFPRKPRKLMFSGKIDH